MEKVYNQKKFYKSPTYYLEADIDAKRNFQRARDYFM